MIAKSKMYFFKYKEKIIMKITFTRQIVVEAMASWYQVILMNMESLKLFISFDFAQNCVNVPAFCT